MRGELEAYLASLGFIYLGQCACRGRPHRWKKLSGDEVKIYNDGRWQLIRGGVVRYGTIETAIAEINDYYHHAMV